MAKMHPSQSRHRTSERDPRWHLRIPHRHQTSRSQAFRQGFFWPSALKDAEKVVKTCEACQKLSPKSNRPSQPLQLIAPAWPLQRWGMDLVGPLPTTRGNYKYAVVAVEYFTKWVEAKPLINITSEAVRKFFWQNIICRFGVPKELMVDNGK